MVFRYEIGQYWRLLKTNLQVVPQKVLVAALDKVGTVIGYCIYIYIQWTVLFNKVNNRPNQVRQALADGTLNEQEHKVGMRAENTAEDASSDQQNKAEVAVFTMIGNVVRPRLNRLIHQCGSYNFHTNRINIDKNKTRIGRCSPNAW